MRALAKCVFLVGGFMADDRVELSSAASEGVWVQIGSKLIVRILGRRSEAGFQGPYMKYMGLEPSLSLGRWAQGSPEREPKFWTKKANAWYASWWVGWLTWCARSMGTEAQHG